MTERSQATLPELEEPVDLDANALSSTVHPAFATVGTVDAPSQLLEEEPLLMRAASRHRSSVREP